jgi:hypothetical protein
MLNKKQKCILFFTTLLFCITTITFLVGCFGAQQTKYYSYLDQGEGAYMLLKLDLSNNKSDSYFYCLSDAPLGAIDYKLADNMRGCDMPGSHLTQKDISKMNLAFTKAKGVKISLTSLVLQGNKISFITQKVNVVDTIDGNFEFNGTKKGNFISGKITLHDKEYPQSYQIEFTQAN